MGTSHGTTTEVSPRANNPKQYRNNLEYHYYYLNYLYWEQIGATLTMEGYKAAIKDYEDNNINNASDARLSEYPLQYRYADSSSTNNPANERQIVYQMKKYAYEVYRVADNAQVRTQLSEYFAFAKPPYAKAKFSYDTVIPEIYIDGPGRVDLKGKLVSWDLDGIYIGTQYHLTYYVTMPNHADLINTTFYPLADYSYCEMFIRSMFYAGGRMPGSGSRYVTYDTVKYFEQIYASGGGEIQQQSADAPAALPPPNTGLMMGYVAPYVFNGAPEVPLETVTSIQGEQLQEEAWTLGEDGKPNIPITADHDSVIKIGTALAVMVFAVLGLYVLRFRRRAHGHDHR